MTVDYMNDTVLVTCASGKQATALLPFLTSKWKHLRLAVNSSGAFERLSKWYPDAEIAQVDLAEPNDCRRLLKNVTSLYHIGPSLHPHETEIGYNMIDAAVAQGSSFKHFVYSSVLNTQLRKLLNHDGKRYVEEYLMESGLDYTILNPSNLLDTFNLQQTISSGIGMCPWSPDIRFTHTCLYDYAEMSAEVLEEREKHYLAQYQAVSTHAMSYRNRCETLGRIIGKEIKAEMIPLEKTMGGEETEKMFGITPHPSSRDAVHRLILYYNHHGLRGNPNVMGWILGRDPMSWEEWINIELAKNKGKQLNLANLR